MGFGLQLANRLSLTLIGERISPVTMPCRYWDLSDPKFTSTRNSEVLSLTARDARHPRMKASVSFEFGAETNVFRWKTRASGGWHILSRPVRLSDDGSFSGTFAL